MLVERGVLLHHVVGAHDGGVAPRVTRTDIAFFKHGNILDAVVFGKVIRRCEPMSSAPDNDHVIGFFRLRVSPSPLPMLMSGERIAQQRPCRVMRHQDNSYMRMRKALGSNGGSICNVADRRSPKISIWKLKSGPLNNSVGTYPCAND